MSDSPPAFALRVAPRAERDYHAALTRIADREGDAAGGAWDEGFQETFSSLATSPRRYALAPDAQGLSGEVRHVTYRRAPGAAPYRLIYRVEENGPDGPTVWLLHVRHGAARPLTRKEGREIETQNRE